MNLCNLFLVWTLRSGARFLRWNNKNTALQDTTVVQEPSWEGMDTNTGFSFGSATVTNSSLRASMPTRKSKASECREIKVFAPTTQDVAMQRLTADLSITIPCVLVLVVIMVVGLGVLIDKQFDRLTWTIQEFVGLHPKAWAQVSPIFEWKYLDSPFNRLSTVSATSIPSSPRLPSAF